MPSASADVPEATPAHPRGWPRVRMHASLLAPWYLPILYRLRPVEVAGSAEVRIRAGWRFEFGDRLDEAELVALLIETCDHVEREHLQRRGDRDRFAWTQAATVESVSAWRDLLEGEMGRQRGFVQPRFPRDTVHPEKFGLAPNRRAEEYYDYFRDLNLDPLALVGPYGPPAGSIRPHADSPGEGVSGAGRRGGGPRRDGDGEIEPGGSGSGDEGERREQPGQQPAAPVPAPCLNGDQPAPARAFVNLAESELPGDEAELEAIRNLVHHHMRQAAPGSLPGNLAREVHRGRQATIPWQVELARHLGRSSGRLDYSLLPRPNYGRLVATGAIGGRLQRGYPRTTVVRDTSASMNERALARVVVEIERLVHLGVDVVIADADARVHRLNRYSRTEVRYMIGGGGTDMLGAAWDAWRRTRPDCLVVLTDGWTSWDEGSREPPDTIWVIVNEEAPYVPSRFRHVVRIREVRDAA